MNRIQLAFRHTYLILVFRPAVSFVHLQFLEQLVLLPQNGISTNIFLVVYHISSVWHHLRFNIVLAYYVKVIPFLWKAYLLCIVFHNNALVKDSKWEMNLFGSWFFICFFFFFIYSQLVVHFGTLNDDLTSSVRLRCDKLILENLLCQSLWT